MKNFLLVAALLAASVCYAKVFRTNCSICGARMVVNTENSDTYGGALTETEFETIFGSTITQSDYFCKRISCAKKAAAIKRERKKQLAASNQKQVDKNNAIKAKRDAVNKMAASLEKYLINAQKNKVDKAEQIRYINVLLKKIPAMAFHRAIIKYASIDVVKHYWGDKNDSQVYLASKNYIEKRIKQEQKNKKNGISLSNLFISRVDGKVKQIADVAVTDKGSGLAFALGVDKKSGKIRYVNSDYLSNSVYRWAIEGNRLDIIAYLDKQCDGKKDIERTFPIVFNINKERNDYHRYCLKKLNQLKEDLKNANDKYDEAKIKKAISQGSAQIEKFPIIKISPEMCKLLWGEIKVYNVFDVISGHRDGSKKYIHSDTVDLIAKYLGDYGDFSEWNNWFKKTINSGGSDCGSRSNKILRIKRTLGSGLDVDPFSFRAFRKPHIRESWIPYEGWVRNVAISSRPGYVTSHQTGYFEWKPNLAHPQKHGFISSEQKDKWVWKSGIFNPSKVGLISDKKEGKWVATSGFVLNDAGNAVWTPGMKHPQHPGLISAKEIFTWIPDQNHAWLNPDKTEDLSVQKDLAPFENFLKNASKVNQNNLYHNY